jgi:ABC-type glycerol-3-phosphate transport system substrate-binding protein
MFRGARLVALGASLALIATACGGDDEADLEALDEEGRQAFSGTELNVLLKEGYEIEAIQEFVGEFEDETGISVNIEVFDEPTARQQFVLDASTAGGSYDITSLSFWNVPEFQRPGWLEPLDEYLEVTDEEWFDLDQISEGTIESMTVDGQLYAIPHTAIGGMVFYRESIFEEHGLEPPQTTDDILALADELEELEPDISPFVGRGAASFASLGSILGWAYGYDAILIDENDTPQADSPEMVEAIEDWVTLMRDYGPADAAALTFTQAGETFQSGQAAMMFDTSGFGTIFEDPNQSQVAGDVGFAQVEGPAGNPIQWLYNEGLAIPASAEDKEAAWLFLQWRMSDEVTMREVTELARTDVPHEGTLASDEYQQFAEENDLVDFVEALDESLGNATGEHWPFYPQFAEIGDAVAATVSELIADGGEVEPAMQDLQSTLEEIMGEPIEDPEAEPEG